MDGLADLLVRYPEFEGLLRLTIAGVVALLIGFDRESKNKPAGVRTNVLVGMGSALFTPGGIYAFGPGDPASRVAAQIVTGIGFLGAGTIIQVRSGVVGLTTAAGIWAVAAVGRAIGAGLYILGAGGGILIFLVLRLLTFGD
ncbi:MAG: MgtC/SapB family protein, partial [Chloroflexota bacterium]|nr:MgtC/SapB family protein [Chloroflexota bacterium]